MSRRRRSWVLLFIAFLSCHVVSANLATSDVPATASQHNVEISSSTDANQDTPQQSVPVEEKKRTAPINSKDPPALDQTVPSAQEPVTANSPPVWDGDGDAPAATCQGASCHTKSGDPAVTMPPAQHLPAPITLDEVSPLVAPPLEDANPPVLSEPKTGSSDSIPPNTDTSSASTAATAESSSVIPDSVCSDSSKINILEELLPSQVLQDAPSATQSISQPADTGSMTSAAVPEKPSDASAAEALKEHTGLVIEGNATSDTLRLEGEEPIESVPVTKDGHLPIGEALNTSGAAGDLLDDDRDTIIKEASPPPAEQEDMPSFQEWTKKRLEEQGKNGSPSQPVIIKNASNNPSHKASYKNYAATDCGAKMLNHNNEAQNAKAVLNNQKDEYMLSPCQAKTWFIIELCEPIQLERFQLANFELFSSSPKEFTASVSDRYPSRDWKLIGNFSAADNHDVQTFEISHDNFAKFLKLEMNSHYGSEHFCPLSLIRVFGTSEYEALDTETRAEEQQQAQYSTDEDPIHVDTSEVDKPGPNLFDSARDAVLSMVKKAARAFGVPGCGTDSTPSSSVGAPAPKNDTASDNREEHSKVCQCTHRISEELTSLCSSLVTLDEFPNVTSSSDELQDQISSLMSCERNSLQRFLKTLVPHDLFDHCAYSCAVCLNQSELISRYRIHPQCNYHYLCEYMRHSFGPVRFGALCQLHRYLTVTQLHKEGICPTAYTIPESKEEACGQSVPEAVTKPVTDCEKELIVESKAPTEILSEKSSDSVPVVVVVPPDDSMTSHESSSLSDSRTTEIKSDAETPPPPSIESTSTIQETSTKHSESEIEPPSESQKIDEIIDQSETINLKELNGTSTSATEYVSSSTVQATEDSRIVPSLSDLPSPLPEPTPTLDRLPAVPELSMPAVVIPSTSPLTPSPPSQGLPVPVAQGGPLGSNSQKGESIFLRISNRIKALELNMSLSSQYLEELSRRYKKQMEEMQRAFNRTISALNDTAKKAYDRDLRQQEMINALRNQLENLTVSVAEISYEYSLPYRVFSSHTMFLFVETTIICVILLILYHYFNPFTIPGPTPVSLQVLLSSPEFKQQLALVIQKSMVASCVEVSPMDAANMVPDRKTGAGESQGKLQESRSVITRNIDIERRRAVPGFSDELASGARVPDSLPPSLPGTPYIRLPGRVVPSIIKHDIVSTPDVLNQQLSTRTPVPQTMVTHPYLRERIAGVDTSQNQDRSADVTPSPHCLVHSTLSLPSFSEPADSILRPVLTRSPSVPISFDSSHPFGSRKSILKSYHRRNMKSLPRSAKRSHSRSLVKKDSQEKQLEGTTPKTNVLPHKRVIKSGTGTSRDKRVINSPAAGILFSSVSCNSTPRIQKIEKIPPVGASANLTKCSVATQTDEMDEMLRNTESDDDVKKRGDMWEMDEPSGFNSLMSCWDSPYARQPSFSPVSNDCPTVPQQPDLLQPFLSLDEIQRQKLLRRQRWWTKQIAKKRQHMALPPAVPLDTLGHVYHPSNHHVPVSLCCCCCSCQAAAIRGLVPLPHAYSLPALRDSFDSVQPVVRGEPTNVLSESHNEVDTLAVALDRNSRVVSGDPGFRLQRFGPLRKTQDSVNGGTSDGGSESDIDAYSAVPLSLNWPISELSLESSGESRNTEEENKAPSPPPRKKSIKETKTKFKTQRRVSFHEKPTKDGFSFRKIIQKVYS